MNLYNCKINFIYKLYMLKIIIIIIIMYYYDMP